jgi:hypothetical protein
MRFVPIAILAVVLLGACAAGTDPRTLIGDPNTRPAFTLPAADGFVAGVAKYTEANGWVIGVSGTTGNILAPAGGTITAIDASEGTYVITIMHNSRYVSRVELVAAPLVRVGDVVGPGQIIGSSNQIRFKLYMDNAAICPYSFLSDTARLRVITFTVTDPC